jgi:RNA polymerase sigma-70 factor (ECF subfamily)
MTDPDPDQLEDLRLVAAARSGDQPAIGTLLTRHQQRMFGLCYHILKHRENAAESCQDAMIKVIQGLDGYDARAKFSTWLTRIVINVCLSRLRSDKIRRMASLDATFGGAGGSEGSEEATLSRRIGQSREPLAAMRVEDSEGLAVLEAALGALDPEQRTIMMLRDQRGLDYDEIGDVLGIAVGTVKSRLFRARAALRAEIERRAGGQE